MTLRLVAALVLLVGTVAASPTAAQKGAPPPPPDNATCLGCHGDASLVSSSGRSVAVDDKKFGDSIHGMVDLACVDCHADLKTTDLPHAEKLARVDCASCHDTQVKAYGEGIHAFARRQNAGSVAATCADCHTAHEIRPSKDSASTTYPLNLPATCGKCHGNARVIEKEHIAIGNVANPFADSIHGRALTKSGLLVAPTCATCHRSHDVRRKADPDSPVNHANIPTLCGTCHEGIKAQYASGVHGSAFGTGDSRAPVCIDCHSAHQIQRADVVTWRLDVIRECGTCHSDKIKTYRDTFHGQVTSLGFVRVATCADCHGAHAIHPGDDERSMVSTARVVSTCQACHADATASFAKYDPHADKHDRDRNPVLYYASLFMTWLLISVFGLFGLHALLWLPRGAAERRRKSLPREAAPAAED